MKSILSIFIPAFLICISNIYAQKDYKEYLQKAYALFAEGEYQMAKKTLNAYQQLSGQTDLKLKKKIELCIDYVHKAEDAQNKQQYLNAIDYYKQVKENNPSDSKISREINLLQNLLIRSQNSTMQEKTYKIGDIIQIGYHRGRIAYLDSSNKHGWVITNIRSVASHGPTGRREGCKGIYGVVPTKEELLVIYRNKNTLGLYNEYWSSSLAKKEKNGWGNWSDDWYYTVDFSSGSVQKRRCGEKGKACYFIEIMKF